jgi:hypothetical protein
MPIDQGQNDPLPFDLSGWNPVAQAVREHLKHMHGRDEDLTEIPEAA